MSWRRSRGVLGPKGVPSARAGARGALFLSRLLWQSAHKQRSRPSRNAVKSPLCGLTSSATVAGVTRPASRQIWRTYRDVELIDSGHHPSGVGEPASTMVAPAVANAIYNAVGVRVRHMPVTPEAVLEGLKRKA